MDAAAVTNSSRILVACTDSSNLLPIFEPHLARHLPLQNLYWKSDSRPLRSISALDVALLPDSNSHQNVSGRRHQIPGLRQTPYVKLYLLRCDDKVAYKETCRKQVKQWVKDIAALPDRNAFRAPVDQHDAFEWLIIHVVLPGTPASTQPVTSKHASLGTTNSTESVSGQLKWPRKGSATLFDRLRADFNHSSRNALERVAQIRISPDQSTNTGQPVNINIEELPGQWDQLVDKLKAATLKSFSTRVSQYEDDIRQRESQRNLPGWNFCTYFVLKEGLAHVFENIGLFKDAEKIYDELNLELDILIRNYAGHQAYGQNSLLLFSKELKAKIRAALDGSEDLFSHSHHAFDTVDVVPLLQSDANVALLDLSTARYREMILANEISAFDFRMHIFTRQLALLIPGTEMASKRSHTDSFRQSEKSLGFDSILKAVQVLDRGMRFVGPAVQSMRSELYTAWGGQDGLTTADLKVQEVVVGNIVGSWTWYLVLQLLQVTDLLAMPSGNALPMQGRHRRNSRSNSLGNGAVTSVVIDAGLLAQKKVGSAQEATRATSRDGHPGSKAASSILQIGSTQLAVHRGQLYLQAREVLKLVWKFEDIAAPWNDEPFLQVEDNTYQNTWNSAKTKALRIQREKLAGIAPQTLRLASASPIATAKVYAKLTELALEQFRLAGALQSATKALTDLAAISHWLCDFAAAASYCGQALDLTSLATAGLRFSRLLRVYCSSLKELQRPVEFLRFSFELLTLYSTEAVMPATEANTILESCVRDVLMACNRLELPLAMPLTSVFMIEESPESIVYMAAETGFMVSLLVRAKVFAGKAVKAEGMIKLKSVMDSEPAHIRLYTKLAVDIGQHLTKVDFYSDVEVFGWYQVDAIELSIAKAQFIEDVGLRHQNIAQAAVGLKKPMLLYPSQSAPLVRLLPALTYDLADPPELRLEIEARVAPLDDCNLYMKSATAGLRLRTNEIRPEAGAVRIPRLPDRLHRLGDISAATKAAFALPYTIEDPETAEIRIQVVLEYTSLGKTICYYTTERVDAILPLCVNVREIFKTTALFSCFTIATSKLVPLQLRGCKIQGNARSQSRDPDPLEPTVVFPQQPAQWTYRFDSDDHDSGAEAANNSRLIIDFQRLDEIVLSAFEEQLLKDLSNSRLSSLSTVLTAHLIQFYRMCLTEQDLKDFHMFQEVELRTYEQSDWALTLSGLHIDAQKEARHWLKAWHQDQHYISLAESKAPVRRVTIPVELPTPNIVISSSLRLAQNQVVDSSVGVGEAVAGELSLSYHNIRSNSRRKDLDLDSIDIHFEIISSAETWLVGGNRRGDVRLQGLHTHVIKLLLIPQRAGYLPLPTIDLQCLDAAQEGQLDQAYQSNIAFEHDDLGQASTILVEASRRFTTMTISSAITTGQERYSLES